MIEIDLFNRRVALSVYKSPSGTCMHLGEYAGSKALASSPPGELRGVN